MKVFSCDVRTSKKKKKHLKENKKNHIKTKGEKKAKRKKRCKLQKAKTRKKKREKLVQWLKTQYDTFTVSGYDISNSSPTPAIT